MMRDPARIPRILEKVHHLWEANPDWRLGQIISNSLYESGISDRPYIFYVEDAVLEGGPRHSQCL